MPDLSWNKLTWDGTYNWEAGGEEWSVAWGGSEAQWFGCIYPRIHRLLPADRVLEIAPGFGRWTKFLLPATKIEYLGIDISEECVNRCRHIFTGVDKAFFHTNDGLSLNMVPDEMFDFVFSFDSLVHVEIDVLEAYVPQILKKLRPNGVAFIHHSNWLNSGDTGKNPHNRAVSVNAEAVAKIVQASGGIVLLQEVLNWGALFCIDCFSVFSRADSHFRTVTGTIYNPRFTDETSVICQTQSPYSKIGQSVKSKTIATVDFDIHEPIGTIDVNDTMYTNDKHYFDVGRSALRNIIHSINIAEQKIPDSILDLPCGYGRVLRYLRAKFPHASITACDTDRDGVDFCVKTFNVKGVYSQKDIRNVSFHDKYDLIWCGSLLTNFDKNAWRDFIKLFSCHLNNRGILVFTTHGRLSVKMLEGHYTYGLDERETSILLTQYKNTGFGYLNYPGNSDYGISVASPSWVLAEVQNHLSLKIILFLEAGWDNHQDVIACIRVVE